MKLCEIADTYKDAAECIDNRIKELKEIKKCASDVDELYDIERRIRDLYPMMRQSKELAELAARYYERGYWRDEKYTI